MIVMKKNATKIYLVLSVSLLLVVYACKPVPSKFSSPKGYNLDKPDRFNMPESLLEISGIAFNNGIADTIYSVQDEEGKVFKQKWDVKKQTNTRFASKGDFEDLAILKDRIFVLKSSGTLYAFPISETSKKETKNVKHMKDVLPDGEYEGMYADAAASKVYVLCKSCTGDKKTKKLSGYIFDYSSEKDTLIQTASFSVDLEHIKALNPKLKASLSPSALARNPGTKEWYILSSSNKLLLVADEQWKIKEVHRLNSSTFNQPEGMAFDKDFNLYISNEGDELTNGNILKFKYTAATK